MTGSFGSAWHSIDNSGEEGWRGQRPPACARSHGSGRPPRRTSRGQNASAPPGKRGCRNGTRALRLPPCSPCSQLLAPLLPASLTAVLLLCAGSGLALFGPRSDLPAGMPPQRRLSPRPAPARQLPELRDHACRAAVQGGHKPPAAARPSKPQLGRADGARQSRPAHAAQCRHRLLGADGSGAVRSAGRRALPGLRASHPRQRHRATQVRRGHPRPDRPRRQSEPPRRRLRLRSGAAGRRRLGLRQPQSRRPRHRLRADRSRPIWR